VADEVRQLAKRTEDATSEISGLVEGIAGSVNTTVSALETSVADAKQNIESLTRLADETTQSSERVQQMRVCMMEVEHLMGSQAHAVERITATVSTLAAISADANRETDALNQLSADLDTAAVGLNRAVDRFHL
jgi:methyl-accepting chemotaxis protein